MINKTKKEFENSEVKSSQTCKASMKTTCKRDYFGVFKRKPPQLLLVKLCLNIRRLPEQPLVPLPSVGGEVFKNIPPLEKETPGNFSSSLWVYVKINVACNIWSSQLVIQKVCESLGGGRIFFTWEPFVYVVKSHLDLKLKDSQVGGQMFQTPKPLSRADVYNTNRYLPRGFIAATSANITWSTRMWCWPTSSSVGPMLTGSPSGWRWRAEGLGDERGSTDQKILQVVVSISDQQNQTHLLNHTKDCFLLGWSFSWWKKENWVI